MELYHYGIKRRSGRYPWGSGDRPFQSLRDKLASHPSYDFETSKHQTRDGLLKKGTRVERVASVSELNGDPHKRKYVSVTEDDKREYREQWEYFTTDDPTLYVYELKKDVHVAEGREVLTDLINKYGDQEAKDYVKLNLSYKDESVIKDIASGYEHKTKDSKKNPYFSKQYSKRIYELYKSKGYTDEEMALAYDLAKQRNKIVSLTNDLLYKRKNTSEEIFKEYRDKGYDAMVDVEDWFSGYAQYPVILLDPAESAKLIEYKDYLDW